MSEKVKVSKHESYGTYTLIAFFIPIVGIIMGIIYLAKDKRLDKKLGEHLIAISILFMIIQSIFLTIFWGNLFGRTAYLPVTSSVVDEIPIVSSWDPANYYNRVKTGHTKAQVEKITGKQSEDCTTSDTPGVGEMEACSYGDILTDKGILMITYLNGKVYDKTKTSL
jgi:hypothetical protein